VRLVHHEEPDVDLAHPLEEPDRREALRSHVEQTQLARRRPPQRLGVRAGVLLGVD
jgi:hypothetical protein